MITAKELLEKITFEPCDHGVGKNSIYVDLLDDRENQVGSIRVVFSNARDLVTRETREQPAEYNCTTWIIEVDVEHEEEIEAEISEQLLELLREKYCEDY